jgi:hypothetical protein
VRTGPFFCGVLLLAGVIATTVVATQAQDDNHRNEDHAKGAVSSDHEMTGMDMDMDSDSAAHAMHTMETRRMDMGPHMRMTELREPKPGDEDRAQKIVEGARTAAEKYRDYHVALADGYHIFLPNVPQKQYHFTNNRYAFAAAFHFNPEHPTSLLYEKHGNDYTLIGVMYTAPKRMNEKQLEKRIPLSIAHWHQHVNFCAPPPDQKSEMFGAKPRFGLLGSISTKSECDAAGGKFYPVIFGWMVHVYPFEQKPENIWAVDRGHEHSRRD